MPRRPPFDNPDPKTPGGRRKAEPDPVTRARVIAVSLLARHAWSRAALRERLIRRGTEEAVAERVLGELERARLIGDGAYAEDAARLELSRKPASDAFLEHKLTGRGVAEATASRAVRAAAEGVSELDRARALARKAVRPAKDDATARRRLLGVLARRGFDHETAERAVEEVLGPAAGGEDVPETGGGQEADHESI